ncbi:hypothetical protein B0T17DRAFT_524413 [Bombardia bombarda]|uniref:Secreted protein n=1 Tax=Bombardia bombarda TaxID=252184 RepID=A0AA40C9C5_9PEZI|nr:hypothetical protein B0T17DRAFT_524413 [Bombardia bombarda]
MLLFLLSFPIFLRCHSLVYVAETFRASVFTIFDIYALCVSRPPPRILPTLWYQPADQATRLEGTSLPPLCPTPVKSYRLNGASRFGSVAFPLYLKY